MLKEKIELGVDGTIKQSHNKQANKAQPQTDAIDNAKDKEKIKVNSYIKSKALTNRSKKQREFEQKFNCQKNSVVNIINSTHK